jgi:hypothetical protein
MPIRVFLAAGSDNSRAGAERIQPSANASVAPLWMVSSRRGHAPSEWSPKLGPGWESLTESSLKALCHLIHAWAARRSSGDVQRRPVRLRREPRRRRELLQRKQQHRAQRRRTSPAPAVEVLARAGRTRPPSSVLTDRLVAVGESVAEEEAEAAVVGRPAPGAEVHRPMTATNTPTMKSVLRFTFTAASNRVNSCNATNSRNATTLPTRQMTVMHLLTRRTGAQLCESRRDA